MGKPILRIPTLAIHLDREVSESFKFNKEQHLTPILAEAAEKELNKMEGSQGAMHHPQLMQSIARNLLCNVDQIQDFELCLYGDKSC